MKSFAIPVVLGLGLAVGASLGAPAASAAESGISEAWNSVKGFTIEQKEEVVSEGQRAIDNFDAQMEQLDAEASKDSAEISAGWEETKTRLGELRDNAKVQLDKLGEASEETWEDLKREFGQSVDDLNDAYDNARNDLGS